MKERLFLIIKKPGLTIDIPGVCSSRSPLKLDITDVDLNKILTYLKLNGIIEYEIKFSIVEPKKNKTKKSIKKIEESETEKFNLGPIYERFNKLEELLRRSMFNNHIRKQDDIEVEKISTKPKKPKIEELETDDFIPSIDLTSLKEKGEFSSRTSVNKSGISENVDSLKDVKKSVYKKGD